MSSIYFDLTREFNAAGPVAILTSGQAVVFYRIAIMSKDGDWILKETSEACDRVLEVLAPRGARYRPSPPLDVRWLAGGWSSHLQFRDERGRRIRCDFMSRPPRVPYPHIEHLFARSTTAGALDVLDVESLILMKQTQRAKDHVVIGELARLLPEDLEIEVTTDPDRIIELASRHGRDSRRPAVAVARAGGTREDVLLAVTRQVNRLQEEDRIRLERYERACAEYIERFRKRGIGELPLRQAHEKAVALAEEILPVNPLHSGDHSP